MFEGSRTAQPAVVPGSPPDAGTMFAALYGQWVPHPWHDPEQDAYALFHQRSTAMGWLDAPTPGPGGASGLWGMNDAGWQHPFTTTTGLASWFQVSVNAVPPGRPLPVQPFLRCAYDATTRAGTLDLSSVQALLPVHGLDATSRAGKANVPAMRTRAWFATCDPRERTAVKISISSGRDTSIADAGVQLIDDLAGLDQDVFALQGQGVTDDELVRPPFDDTFWNGPPLHGITLHGELAEWSADAIGWLAEVLTHSAAHRSVRTPVLFTATRTA